MPACDREALTGTDGRTIHDPTTGETIMFIETSAESGGARVVMRLGLAPGTVVPPHAHPIEEIFECVEGQLAFQLNDRTIHLRPGGTVSARSGQLHGFCNVSDDPAALRIVATPGTEAEYGLRVKFLLSRDGYLPHGAGPPKHLLLAAIVLHRGGLYFPPLPRWLFRLLIGCLAALGRWRGRETFLLSHYPEYRRYLESLGRGARRTEHEGDNAPCHQAN